MPDVSLSAERLERLQRFEADLEIIDSLRRAETVEDLLQAATRWAKQSGFDRWIYGVGSPVKVQLFGTYPDEWMDDFKRGNGESSDPLVRAALRSQQPFMWDLRTDETRQSMTLKTFQDRWDHGIRSGLTLPLFGGIKAACVISFSNEKHVDAHTRYWQEPLAVMFATTFQMAMARVLSPQHVLQPGIDLTPQQIEVLKWGAAGKSNAAIAGIMGIAESTVKYHFKSAGDRLGMTGRSGMISKALMLGLIEV